MSIEILINDIINIIAITILLYIIYQMIIKNEIKKFMPKNKKHNTHKKEKSKIKKSAKELSMMTPKEKQDAFFNACWEEIEKSAKRRHK